MLRTAFLSLLVLAGISMTAAAQAAVSTRVIDYSSNG